MRGSVGKDAKRGTWFFCHDVTGPEGRRQKRKRGYPTKRDAERALQLSLWEAGQRGTPPPSLTVAGYLSRRIDALEHKLAPTTVDRYRRTVRAWLQDLPFGTLPLTDVTAAAAQGYVRDLSRVCGLSPGSVGACWQAVHALLRPLVDAGSLPAEALRVDLPRVPRPPLRVWTPEQTRVVLEALRGGTLYVPALVAVTTGVRIGELLALEWTDLQGGGLLVEKTVYRLPGEPARTKETKTGRGRRVDLYPETQDALQAHQEAQERRRRLFPEWRAGGLIFPGAGGGYARADHLAAFFQRRLHKIAVPRIRWHDLRHTHASHLLAAGVPPTSVAARLGHTVQTCLRVYAHLIPGQQQEAVRLGAAFLSLGATRDHEASPAHD